MDAMHSLVQWQDLSKYWILGQVDIVYCSEL